MPKKKKSAKNKEKLISKSFIPELKLEMLNNKELIIEGCKGVIEYGDNFIKLNTGKIMTEVKGNALIIESYDSEVVVIKGVISDISFNS